MLNAVFLCLRSDITGVASGSYTSVDLTELPVKCDLRPPPPPLSPPPPATDTCAMYTGGQTDAPSRIITGNATVNSFCACFVACAKDHYW